MFAAPPNSKLIRYTDIFALNCYYYTDATYFTHTEILNICVKDKFC